LIAAAGTLGETELFGRAVIADGRLVDKYVGPDALVLEFREPGGKDNLYTYAFLCTSIGFQSLRSACYGTKILGIRKDMLADLPIPLGDEDAKSRIASLVRNAVEQRERYLTQLRAARKVIEDLPEMIEARDMCEERKAKCLIVDASLSTLQAWTYASTGGALGFLQRKWSGRLGDVLQPNGVFNGPRFARIPCQAPHGVDFLSQRHLFLIRPVLRRIVHPGFADRLFFVPQGSLLVAGHGTLNEGEIFGRVAYVSSRLSRMAFTQDLLRIQPKPEYSSLCFAFLSSLVGFRLLRSTAVGTKILLMRPDLLRQLPLPENQGGLIKKITKHLDAALSAREDADNSEQEAIRIVENEVLPAWLN